MQSFGHSERPLKLQIGLAAIIYYPGFEIYASAYPYNISMKKKLRIRIGKCYVSRSLMPGQMDFYASIRSGIKKVKTKIKEGPNPDFNEIFDLEAESYILKLKVKDAGGASCLGSCSPFNTLLGEAQVDITQCVTNMEKVEGFYSLKYDGNNPAGKIYLTITPLQG